MTSGKKRISDHVGLGDAQASKVTLFESPRLLLGLNLLKPGETQRLHDHPGQDKFYLVHDGTGRFTVGSETFEGSAGDVVWAGAGVPHGVENTGVRLLTLLVGIAPAPVKKS